jgi:hypothetical protein
MKRATKKERYQKILNMIRRHGQVIVVFEDMYTRESFGEKMPKYLRKRKVDLNGRCYVSYLGHESRRWSRYSTSCFVSYSNCRDLQHTIREMVKHDRGMVIPVEILIGKRRIKL